MSNDKAISAAQAAADKAFDNYLAANHAGAASSVPDCVAEAAQKAYAYAGGRLLPWSATAI